MKHDSSRDSRIKFNETFGCTFSRKGVYKIMGKWKERTELKETVRQVMNTDQPTTERFFIPTRKIPTATLIRFVARFVRVWILNSRSGGSPVLVTLDIKEFDYSFDSADCGSFL